MSSSGNGTRVSRRIDYLTSTRRNTRKGTRLSTCLEGTTISFTAPNTVSDSGNGLTAFAVGDEIIIKGTASNQRRAKLLTVAAGSATVDPRVFAFVTEAAGATVRLCRY